MTEYRSSIGARESYSAHHLRSPGAPMHGGGGRVLKIVTEMGASSLHGISPAFGSNAASAILESREREKREMQDLNDRLGSYIERVRFLEAENRRLAKELEDLRGNWGTDTREVKIKFTSDLSEARRLIDDTAKDKANVEVLIARLTAELNEYRGLWVILVPCKWDGGGGRRCGGVVCTEFHECVGRKVSGIGKGAGGEGVAGCW